MTLTSGHRSRRQMKDQQRKKLAVCPESTRPGRARRNYNLLTTAFNPSPSSINDQSLIADMINLITTWNK